MIFTFEIHSEDNPSLTANIMLLIHGRVLDDPGAIALTINGMDRAGQWSGNELVLTHPIAVKFGPDITRVIRHLEVEDLPTSVVQALHAVSEAGAEAGVTTCDLCKSIVAAHLVQAFTVCACPECQETKQLKAPDIQVPPF